MNEEFLRESVQSMDIGVRIMDEISEKIIRITESFDDDITLEEEDELVSKRLYTLRELFDSIYSYIIEFKELLENSNATNEDLKNFIDKINDIYEKNKNDDENDYFLHFDND